MDKVYKEYQRLDLPSVDKEILAFWAENGIFQKSLFPGQDRKEFTFYEGPPSANGSPGIHHVMARAIKDIFCRYNTLKGYRVNRKGGWDTHGLPVELQVEKALGITKDDIGKTISVKEYNDACRKDVLKYKDQWDDLTQKMGYWLDLDNPYVTFENEYIESLWALLKRLYDKGFLYKGYTIQPYSPAAGTGLSSHELNQPGAYRDIRDTTVVAQFKAIEDDKTLAVTGTLPAPLYYVAWTTTPWTLPSNSALAIGKSIEYGFIHTFNPYTYDEVVVVMANELVTKFFSKEQEELSMQEYKAGDKKIPYRKLQIKKGAELEGLEYEQLMPYVTPDEPAFRLITADFVSTEDGTGVVHISPTFGSDDFMVAKKHNIPPVLVWSEELGKAQPLVDTKGKFVNEVTDFAGEYVKEQYLDSKDITEGYKSVDVRIAIMLKEQNKAFKVEKYAHSYPHCWRTDKPILYYPLDSWFIKTTAVKDRLIELNNTINWKPASTGTGRFGDWLKNLQDWNLSRSRFWGTPLPIWSNGKTGKAYKEFCVGAISEILGDAYFISDTSTALSGTKEKTGISLLNHLNAAIEDGKKPESILQNWIENGDLEAFDESKKSELDLHKHYVDRIVYVKDGELFARESDLIDVWFDSGAMPFAQWHYPFENLDKFKSAYPADFIAEGVDQTRGWFFTLHAISTMLEDKVAYKNVIANGLVLDKNGNKMSKRLGNAADPFKTIASYGADATRWYMVGNASPWENLKFNELGIVETQNKFFGTLFNTYNFYALYANIDSYSIPESRIPYAERTEIDRWILSVLHALVSKVKSYMDGYDPTPAVRLIEEFVIENLSNWYVRLCRRRFWKGVMNKNKESAYQTLFECMHTVSIMMSPFAPFFSERLYQDLKRGSESLNADSVHIASFPEPKEGEYEEELVLRMDLAQKLSSLVHSIRKRKDISIKIRQPLQKILVPIMDSTVQDRIEQVKPLILSETNVKEIQYETGKSEIFNKELKPNFPVIGKKPELRRYMKQISAVLRDKGTELVSEFENNGCLTLDFESSEPLILREEDLEIVTTDVPGWASATNGKLTVALDINISEDLKNEGIARELVNRIQNIRKENGYELTNKIKVALQHNEYWDQAVNQFLKYICSETLAIELNLVSNLKEGKEIIINNHTGSILIHK